MFKFFHMRTQWYHWELITFIFRELGGGIAKKSFSKNPRLLWKWVGVSMSHSDFLCGKSSQNSPKPVLVFWSSIPCVFCLYTLLKVVVIMIWVFCSCQRWFAKKCLDECGWVGFTVGGFLRPIQFVFVFLETNYLCKAPWHHRRQVDERQVAEKRGSRKRQYAPDVSQLMHPSVKWHRRQFTMLVISITLLKSMNDVSLI